MSRLKFDDAYSLRNITLRLTINPQRKTAGVGGDFEAARNLLSFSSCRPRKLLEVQAITNDARSKTPMAISRSWSSSPWKL